VASGLGPMAVGSDGGGSIRAPASFCGIFGLKPSHGRIPIYPILAGWETLDRRLDLGLSGEKARPMPGTTVSPKIQEYKTGYSAYQFPVSEDRVI